MDKALKYALQRNAQEILNILSESGIDVSNYEKILTESPKEKRKYHRATTPEEIAKSEKRREYRRNYKEKQKRLAIEAEEERKRWQERQRELQARQKDFKALNALPALNSFLLSDLLSNAIEDVRAEEERKERELNRELSPLYEFLQYAEPIQKRVNKRREREEERKRQEENNFSHLNALIQTAEEIKPTIEEKETPLPTLSDLRKEKGLTARTVADKLNVSASYLKYIERNLILDTAVYSRLAKIYRVRQAEIYKRLLPAIRTKNAELLARYIIKRIKGANNETTGKRQNL